MSTTRSTANPAPASSGTPGTGTVGSALAAPSGFGTVTVTVTAPDGRQITVCLWLAETAEQHQRGLMFVTDPELGGKAGMLFRFSTDTVTGFWMKNTVLPLSIAYVAADGSIVSTADMAPCPDDAARCPSYAAAGPYRYAIEVPQGRLTDLGVEPGSTVQVGDSECHTATSHSR